MQKEPCSLRKQLTYCDANTAFSAKWCLRKDRYSILMTCHYLDCTVVLLIGQAISSAWKLHVCFSDIILRGKQWWWWWWCHRILAVFSGQNPADQSHLYNHSDLPMDQVIGLKLHIHPSMTLTILILYTWAFNYYTFNIMTTSRPP